jgi:two-component system sensor histidine kinase AgrC
VGLLVWNLIGAAVMLLNGWLLYRLCTAFLCVPGLGRRIVLLLTFAGSSGMIIRVGDPNLLYTLPVFLGLFFFCTRGDRVGRLTMAVIFFCLVMSISTLMDTYLEAVLSTFSGMYMVTRVARPVVGGLIYLVFRRILPQEPVTLSLRMWRLVLGLAAMPFCALVAVVLLTYSKYDSPALYSMAMNLGMVVVPFVLLTAVMLLRAVLVLANHEKLEQASRLAGLREVYYQGLRQQERQVRTLRHDLRNHLTVVRGRLEQGDTAAALAYLEELSASPALRGGGRICENDAANAVLTAKAEAMRQAGVTADFAVSLPESLPLADTDLTALLGNALDNALEAAERVEHKIVTVRCKADKGLLMLRVENAVEGEVHADLSTTKADKSSHGFGIPGMREIAERCGGTLSAGIQDGRFQLLVCIPL